MNRKGFTLAEILVAVLITSILVTMAVPMYDKAIEKSRIVEARAMLKRIHESKMRLLEQYMDSSSYEGYKTSLFGFENLDMDIKCDSSTSENSHVITCSTKDFRYSLNPSGGSGTADAVCAVRLKGDNAGVNFLYYGELRASSWTRLFCNNNGVSNGCDAYGLDSDGNTAWCGSAS